MSTTQAKQSFFTELRGPVGFESIYQGLPSTTPIILSDRPSGLDPDAEQQLGLLKNVYSQNGRVYPIVATGEGVSPYLIAGLPVPAMATALLWLPPLRSSPAVPNYQYQIIWRIRSFQTLRSKRRPFHGKNNKPGPSDSGKNNYLPPLGGPAWTGASQNRLPILAAEDTLTYAQAEPTVTGVAEQNLYWSNLVPIPLGKATATAPVLRSLDGTTVVSGQVGQGILPNPPSAPPTHTCTTTLCKGDEMCVLVSRPTSIDAPTWDFEGNDINVSRILGRGLLVSGAYIIIHAGVMVATGVSP